MSYTNQSQDPRRRLVAIAGVTAIHAAIAVGLVAGLTVSGYAPPIDTWDPFEITPDPLPTPPPPDPQPQPEARTVITIPPTPLPPLAPTDTLVVPEQIVVPETPVTPYAGPTGAPVPEALPSTAFTPTKPRPSNDASRWITTADYPGRDLRDGNEGLAAYRLIVGTNGRVSACEITRTAGSRGLDQATCDFITRRARFEAATDQTGAKVVGTYTGTVRWDIPE